MALDLSEDMVILTPEEINRFISTLKVRYASASPKKKSGKTARA
ncbi:MAG: hypothetical protein QXJ74_09615 [Nitrososphaera sp.]|nr:hypothetical protein [Nitrososphaera sp.]